MFWVRFSEFLLQELNFLRKSHILAGILLTQNIAHTKEIKYFLPLNVFCYLAVLSLGMLKLAESSVGRRALYPILPLQSLQIKANIFVLSFLSCYTAWTLIFNQLCLSFQKLNSIVYNLIPVFIFSMYFNSLLQTQMIKPSNFYLIKDFLVGNKAVTMEIIPFTSHSFAVDKS